MGRSETHEVASGPADPGIADAEQWITPEVASGPADPGIADAEQWITPEVAGAGTAPNVSLLMGSTAIFLVGCCEEALVIVPLIAVVMSFRR
jgi:hypothetical protein